MLICYVERSRNIYGNKLEAIDASPLGGIRMTGCLSAHPPADPPGCGKGKLFKCSYVAIGKLHCFLFLKPSLILEQIMA
jgi:hypothetical protein